MRPSPPTDLAARFERQRDAFAREPDPPPTMRLSRIA